MEGSVLVQGHFLYLAVELRPAGLIDSAGFLQVAGAHGLKHTENAGSIDFGRGLGRVETDLLVDLGGQVANLGGVHPTTTLTMNMESPRSA